MVGQYSEMATAWADRGDSSVRCPGAETEKTTLPAICLADDEVVEARSILTARQKLERQCVDPGSFALVKIAWGDEIPTD